MTSRSSGIFAILLTCLFIASAKAQEDTSLIRVLTVSVHSGMNGPFEEFIRALRDASREQGLDGYWLSAQSLSGDPVYRFHLQMSDWGDLLEPGANLAEAFGEEEAARLGGLARDSIASTHSAIYREYDNMSYTSPAALNEPPEGLIYLDFTLNPGTAAMFQEMARAQKEASTTLYPEDSFGVSMPEFGGSGPRTILILQSLDDIDEPSLGAAQRLFEHFGQQEGARLNELAGQSIVSFESTLFRTRPDLNYQPTQ